MSVSMMKLKSKAILVKFFCDFIIVEQGSGDIW